MLDPIKSQRVGHDLVTEQQQPCTYMESRKMVLMNLFAGRNRHTDIENRLVGTEGKERVE